MLLLAFSSEFCFLLFSAPALALCFSSKSDKTFEFVYMFHKGLSEKRSNSCTLLSQAGGLMSRLHANS